MDGNTALCYFLAYAYQHTLISVLTDDENHETLNWLPQKTVKKTLKTTYSKVEFQNFPGVKPRTPLQKGWGRESLEM